MRAAALKDGRIYVKDDVPEPVPGFGQVLVQVKACGICGSDLHFAKHGAEMLALTKEMGGLPAMDMGSDLDLSQDVFMGHEFSAEVLDVGPDTVAPAPGTIVTSIPILFTPEGALRPIVYSNEVAGGYGERMLLAAPMVTEVPNGLDFRHAALTEPMAVGLHAVNKSRIEPGEGALVLGCGPVGLAVIGALKLKGIDTIVATDFSPTRRALATTMGATEVVDLDAGVVCRRELTGRGGQRACLEQGVLLEGGAGLLDPGVMRLHRVRRAQDLLDLLELVDVPGRQQDPHQRGAGGSLTISCCRPMISLMPPSANMRSESSSARL